MLFTFISGYLLHKFLISDLFYTLLIHLFWLINPPNLLINFPSLELSQQFVNIFIFFFVANYQYSQK